MAGLAGCDAEYHSYDSFVCCVSGDVARVVVDVGNHTGTAGGISGFAGDDFALGEYL